MLLSFYLICVAGLYGLCVYTTTGWVRSRKALEKAKRCVLCQKPYDYAPLCHECEPHECEIALKYELQAAEEYIVRLEARVKLLSEQNMWLRGVVKEASP